MKGPITVTEEDGEPEPLEGDHVRLTVAVEIPGGHASAAARIGAGSSSREVELPEHALVSVAVEEVQGSVSVNVCSENAHARDVRHLSDAVSYRRAEPARTVA